MEQMMPVRKPSLFARIRAQYQRWADVRRLRRELGEAYKNIDLLANVNQEIYTRNIFLEQEIELMRAGIQNVR